MKKIIFTSSLFGSVLFLLFLFATQIGLCRFINVSCTYFFDPLAEIVFIFFPLFLFSVITYRMKEVVINRWLKFVYIWVPLTVILVFLAPEYDSSLLPLEKGTVALTMSGLFVFISLLIILVSYLRKTKQ